VDPNNPNRDERWNEDTLQYSILKDPSGNIIQAGDALSPEIRSGAEELVDICTGEDYLGPPNFDEEAVLREPLPPGAVLTVNVTREKLENRLREVGLDQTLEEYGGEEVLSSIFNKGTR
jgi:hypothetical protein